jgi:transcription-repair coupling factor (superfamily II helicase)
MEQRVVIHFSPATTARPERMAPLLNRYSGTLTPQGVMSLNLPGRRDADILRETIAVLKGL